MAPGPRRGLGCSTPGASNPSATDAQGAALTREKQRREQGARSVGKRDRGCGQCARERSLMWETCFGFLMGGKWLLCNMSIAFVTQQPGGQNHQIQDH